MLRQQTTTRVAFSTIIRLGSCLLLTNCLGSASKADCASGSEGCACYRNDTCDDGLSCRSSLCVDRSGSQVAADAGPDAGDHADDLPVGDSGAQESDTAADASDGNDMNVVEDITDDGSATDIDVTDVAATDVLETTDETGDTDEVVGTETGVAVETDTAVETDVAIETDGPDGGLEQPAVIYESCRLLHDAQPELPSGEYTVQPQASEAFTTYCDMTTDGGGWTLAFNEDPTFDPTADGETASGCFSRNCTNRAYSTVPVALDIMFQAADEDIAQDNWLAQIIVRGVHEDSRGRTLRGLMDAPGKFFLEAEDNSNLELTANAAGDPCDVIVRGFRRMACDTPVFTFADVNDNTACSEQESVGHKFALGGETSYSEHWYNCAGWPQHPINQGVSEMPTNFRFFVR